MFPPIPSWDAMHPLVVHFPIALLLVAPLFVVLAAVWRRYELPLAVSALTRMALGAIGAFVAAATGEAGEGAANTAAAKAVLERHEELAEIVEATFATLAAVFAVMVFAPRLVGRWRRLPRVPNVPGTVRAAGYGMFLVAYEIGCLILATAAHEGGRLVHEFGVRAAITSPAAPRAAQNATAHAPARTAIAVDDD
jgi:uncharacterized membrane protein